MIDLVDSTTLSLTGLGNSRDRHRRRRNGPTSEAMTDEAEKVPDSAPDGCPLFAPALSDVIAEVSDPVLVVQGPVPVASKGAADKPSDGCCQLSVDIRRDD